ncbi:MAG: cardiolipin synthase ClsB [Betaproteobacteria bacterium]|nr:cardiolipin synthase ClsB [Betaproteobacteria bacterium]
MTEFVDGNRITLLRSGVEYFPALEAEFDAARREIHLETYIFEDDASGRAIASALARAARRGVATHVMVDGFGSKDMNPELVTELKAAGVHLLVYRPDISPWSFQRARLRRLPRQVAVIAARVAFAGGINIIDDINTPGHTPPRFDYAVRVQGPLVARMYPVVKRLWALVTATQFKSVWPRLRDLGPFTVPRGGQRAGFLVRDNFRHRRDIEQAYLAAIEQARSEILVANPYFFPGLSFRRALMDAAARGVRVVLLLQGRVEYVLLHYASRALYGAFLDAGIEIHEYHKSFLHAKVAVIDQHWATVGSSNIDPFSLLLAREANIVIEDRGFAAQLRQSLTAAMADGARQLRREGWKDQPLTRRTITWICYGLARLLTGVFAYGRAQEFT